MATLMSHQSARQEHADSASATSWFPAGPALGFAGLATASTAITIFVVLAISQSLSPSSSDQPAAADDSSRCYHQLLALSAGLFYTGVAELGAAVWVMSEPRGRVAAGRRLAYASLVPLMPAAAGLLAAATLFW